MFCPYSLEILCGITDRVCLGSCGDYDKLRDGVRQGLDDAANGRHGYLPPKPQREYIPLPDLGGGWISKWDVWDALT